MAERLTFNAYCDLVIARLYEIEQNGEKPRADVRELMADLGPVVPDDWAYEAAKHIADAELAYDYVGFGSPQVQLNADGRLLAESGVGIIGDYQRSSQITLVYGDGNQIAVAHGQNVTQTIRPRS
jgi:hypothetical protein